jgi:type II secretory pathway component PulM
MALFGKMKASLANSMAPIEARLDAILAGMKPRDRLLLSGVVGAVILSIVLGIGLGMRSSLAGMDTDLQAEKTRLVQVREMAKQYAGDAERVIALEASLNEHKGKDLSAFLEQAASKAQAGDSLTAVTPTSTSTIGSLEQKNYTANLRKVTLEQALEFLYEAEGKGYPLKIQSANIKVGRGSEKLLTLNLEVATYALTEEEASP